MPETWNKLPMELKLKILQPVVNHVKKLKNQKARARYACVNREFQEVFERESFRTLAISNNRIEQTSFHRIVTGARRDYLQTLYYQIRIPKHSDDQSKDFSQSIWDLFQMLNGWSAEDPDILERRRGRGIELDIVVDARCTTENPSSGGDSGREILNTPLEFVHHELGALAEPQRVMVDLVTKLSITRKTPMTVSPVGISKLVNCLPRLEELCYEPNWISSGLKGIIRGWEHLSCDRKLLCHAQSQVRPIQPPGGPGGFPKRVCLFHHAAELQPSTDSWDDAQQAVDYRKREIKGNTLAHLTASHGLEHFSSIGGVDAFDFFSAPQSALTEDKYNWFKNLFNFPSNHSAPILFDLPIWDHLRTLALTSDDLAKDGDPNPLLLAAARAARRMKALVTMKIFHLNKNARAIFRYCSHKAKDIDPEIRNPHASLKTSFKPDPEYQVSEEVKDAWAETAKYHRDTDVAGWWSREYYGWDDNPPTGFTFQEGRLPKLRGQSSYVLPTFYNRDSRIQTTRGEKIPLISPSEAPKNLAI